MSPYIGCVKSTYSLFLLVAFAWVFLLTCLPLAFLGRTSSSGGVFSLSDSVLDKNALHRIQARYFIITYPLFPPVVLNLAGVDKIIGSPSSETTSAVLGLQ